ITLKEFKIGLNERERNKQSSDKTKFYVTKQGDSLWSIAYREYGDPALWRYIADANKIHDPRSLETGAELIIPSVE
ncbi:MAG TPA: LysM peptidoglycan-binding domain-containing protein, partial [Methanomethylovorans sp.]|nr:LysM peptidoglycan-binding domain-containing protein [Methanomethylovorans sp.]